MSGNPIFITIKGIVATYLNRIVESKNGKIDVLLDTAINTFKTPKDMLGDGTETEIYQSLLETLSWLRVLPKDITLSPIDLIEKIRADCGYHTNYMETIEQLLRTVNVESIQENENKIKLIINEINFALRRYNLGELFKKANKDINFNDDNIDLTSYAHDFESKLRDLSGQSSDNVIGRSNGRFNIMEEETVDAAFEKAAEYESAEGRLRTGLKGFNRMLGGDGYRRGEQFNWGGLTHSGKSYLLLKHGEWFCRFNKPMPQTLAEGEKPKIPLILHVTFENKIEQNIVTLFQNLFEEVNQKRCDRRNINVKEASSFIRRELGKNGFTYEMLSYNPNGFDVWALIDVINYYISKGYEIYAIIVDYPDLISKMGNGSRSNARRRDEEIVYTFETLRNHCFELGITQITAHQLSTKAQEIAREAPRGFAKKVCTGSYYMDCNSLGTKLDGEAIIHKIQIGDKYYLTFARGKHRGGEHTPVLWQSGAYEFMDLGGIVSDLDVEKPEGNCIYSFAGIEDAGETGGMDLTTEEMESTQW